MSTARTSARWGQRLAGFFCLVVLANPLAQLLGIKYCLPYTEDRTLKVYVYQRDKMCPDVVMLGSSKIIRATIPSVMEPILSEAMGRRVDVFCLGQAGTSAYANFLVLRDVVASNGAPRLVVLEASPGALNENHENVPRALRYYCSFHDLLAALPHLRNLELVEAAGAGAFRGLSNFAQYGWSCCFPGRLRRQMEAIRFMKGCAFSRPLPVTPWRLSSFPQARKEKELDRIRSGVRHSFLNRFRIGGAPAAGLREMCRLAKRKNMKLIIISPPVTKAYRQTVFYPEEYQEFTDFMREMAEEGSIEFLDLNDAPLRLGLDDYFDFGHVNSAGAGKVSRYLARMVLAPALRQAEQAAAGARPS